MLTKKSVMRSVRNVIIEILFLTPFFTGCAAGVHQTRSKPLPTGEVRLTPAGVISSDTRQTSIFNGTALASTEPTSSPEPNLLRIVELAKADLAQHLSVSAEQIQFTESQTVRWPDTSLGCALPGMSYINGIIPGYWISLQVKDQRYIYHSDQQDRVILCAGPSEEIKPTIFPTIPVTPGEIQDGEPWMPVD